MWNWNNEYWGQACHVAVNDKLPQDHLLASGNATWSGFLDAGKGLISGILLTVSNISPAADATYRDILDCKAGATQYHRK